MRETDPLRRLVFQMVADGELSAEAAMALLRRSKDLAPVTAEPPARDIAVVGMAGRFGSAPDLESYWRMLEAGDNCLVEMPSRRWPTMAGKRRHGGFLPDEDRFDSLFFRISPTEAAMMDPQQRLFLETAFHALEDAGYAEPTLSGSRCGVFVGAGAGDYAQRFRDAGLESNPLGLMGNVTSILAARISYFLNLKGPSVALDTACSSSLVAVHLACESLLAGTCDMALAGGVAVISTPQFIGAMVEGGMLSPNDRCASFDAAADGFVCGEGSGVVVLKRLADAECDGDFIHGVIRGSGINQDGRTNGITAPSAPSQAALEAELYARIGVSPDTINYIETHGTGTPLGDPIEVEALTSAFRRSTDRVGFCALGSAKANIGHALTAAGIAGLLKVLLMLRHRRIPPMAGFNTPNPRIDFASSPFTVPTSASDWTPDGPRRASVSSFGFSGTNAHVVVEQTAQTSRHQPTSGPFLFLLSARGPDALRARAVDLAERIAGNDLDAADVAFTLAVGRDHYPHRLAIVADDTVALRTSLQRWAAGDRDPSSLSGEVRAEGPGPALLALGEQVAREPANHDRLRILADLYVQGAALHRNWQSAGRRVPLPVYPFERIACGMPIAAPPAAESTRDVVQALDVALGASAAPDLAEQAQAFRGMEAWGRRALAGAYAAMGLFQKHVHTVAGLRKALGIAEPKRRLHDALIDMLVRDNVLLREGDLLRAVAPPAIADLTAERHRLAEEQPELAPFLTLLSACIDGLPKLLTGQITATEVMFPDGRMDLVEPIYKGNRLADHFNTILADGVAMLSARHGGPVRVLEVGAGTGGATTAILRTCSRTQADIEYHYTDISVGFVTAGRQNFGTRHDFMRFATLDIERDPSAQGFAAGSFDIVVASNVLHASRDIAVALGHVAQLLRPGGFLLLSEVTALQDYATLTFGLTDGWWAFQDASRRIANAPLLDVALWRQVLMDAGFPRTNAFGLPGESHDQRSQSILIAERDPQAIVTAETKQPAARPIGAPQAPLLDATGLEAIVAQEVASALTLPIERLDPRGRFMDYGIDSILGGQVVARLNRILSLDLRPTVVFDHPSIRDLARFIQRDHGVRLRTLPIEEPQTDTPASSPDATASDDSAEQRGREADRLQSPVDTPRKTPRPDSEAPATTKDQRIAVIGAAGRFADCPDIAAFHAMLAEGRSGITEVPADRWSADASALPDGVSSEAAYLRWGGFLKDAADFDPLFFRMSGKEAELTDPQHRVFLTEAWRALEDAGYAERDLDGRRCGVFVGAYGGDYTHRMTDLGIVPEAFAFMGNAAAILSGRIAYVLNLKGPCMAVDTACSSSLTAIHLACRSLLDGDCDMALAGGVFLTTTMGFNTAAAKAGMLSPVGACKTFDADADGFVPGEGAGVVVLKPYARALADGDHIEAVILASAINQDGKTNGITAPSPDSQAALEIEVYTKAGIDPDAISYVEAHGTGTKLGDPIEIQGLTRAFRKWTDRTGFCAIGSVKTNIGHAAHAAGIAGFLKVVLALRHRALFPSRNFRSENPELHLGSSPFFVNTVLRPWETDGKPRMGAVSSFGFSGTNVHILLTEAAPAPGRALSPGPCLIAMSARNPASLRRRLSDLRAWLNDNQADLADIARTLNAGRCHFEHRWVAIVASTDDLARALASDQPIADTVIDLTNGQAPALLEAARDYLRTGDIADSAIPPRGRRISLPTYPFDMRRYWLDRDTDAAATPRPVATTAVHYLVPAWQPAEVTPGRMTGPIWLVAEIGGLASDLARIWRTEGASVFHVAPTELTEIETLRARHGAPTTVVCLADIGSASAWDPARLDADLGTVPRAVFHLTRLLFADPTRILCVHRGSPVHECVHVLRRSAHFDGASVDVRLLRLDGRLPPVEHLAALIAAELQTPHDPATEAAIRDGRRLVRRMVVAEAPSSASPAPRPGGHFVITGGGGVLAGVFARRLAAATGGRITLIGRSPASQAVHTLLSAIPTAGYRQADITDEAALTRVLADARAVNGPIHGVIHAAGVPGGAPLRDNDWAGIASCLAPKVTGTVTLDRALRDDVLDFFVLFSSLASELGDFGQGAYAAGNAFCDRFAAWRDDQRQASHRHGRTVALGWPLWREGRGVLSAEGEKLYLATAGMPYLETEQGWRAFLDALAMPHAQVSVIPGDRAAALALFDPRPRKMTDARPGEMSDTRHDTMSDSRPREPVRDLGPSQRRTPQAPAEHRPPPPASGLPDSVRRHLTALVSKQMKIDEDLLVSDTGLAEFGFDSIALKELGVRLGDAYGISISPAVFFAHGTIDALAAYLAQTYPTEIAAKHAAPSSREQAPIPTPPPTAQPLPEADTSAIAIIGISGRFPGSPDLDAFWRHLQAGTDLVGPLPDGRDLASRAGYDRDALVGGFLDRIDTFDAPFFRISPREACFLDPQHRLAIEAVWHCVEDAGLKMSSLAGRSVGVFFGPQINEYGAIIPDRDTARAQIALGNIATMLPNRISYLFDLRGPSEAIDTACSSSLVAVHRAVRALQSGECDMALAGGVSLVLTAESIVSTMELGVVSAAGRCHSFDARADGYVKGEGVGVVLLKPLAKAQADGDVIHAVILGSAENHGGHAHSLTAPNGTAQAALIAAALRRAGVASDTIGYVEAHGTGTELGDPVEVMALKEAFAATAVPGSVARPSCLLGTVKTNIGHLEPASGVAGLLKAVLALEHRTLPASLHFQQLNPLIDFANTPFAVVDSTRAWDRLTDPAGHAMPRRAGVSSFGLGGSNVHMVLEEAAETPSAPSAESAELLVVSARDRDRLAVLLRRLANFVATHPTVAARDIAHTLAVGREPMPVRAALLWRPGQSLAGRLSQAAEAVDRSAEAADLWTGSVGGAGLRRDDRADASHLLADLLATGQLGRLGALWVGGSDLPPNTTQGQRIALPGYPFAPTRFWFDRASGSASADRAVSGDAEGVGPRPGGTVAVEPSSSVASPVRASPMAPPPASSSSGLTRPSPTPVPVANPHVAPNAYAGGDARVEPEHDGGIAASRLSAPPAVTSPTPASPVAGPSTPPPQGRPSRPVGSPDAVRSVVRRQLAAALYLDEAQLDDHAGFADLGLDSILAVELTKSLNDELGTTLQATRLYDYANVAELAAYLHASLEAPEAAPAAAPPRASGPSLQTVRDVVRRQLAAALYLEEPQLDDHAGFADLGLDSILAVELTKSLNDELGTSLQATRLYDYANVAELAGHLRDMVAEQSAPTGNADKPTPEADFLIARLAKVGAGGLTIRTRLDAISLQPAQAKSILADINARFGCSLTEGDVGRSADLGALAALIATRSAADAVATGEISAARPTPDAKRPPTPPTRTENPPRSAGSVAVDGAPPSWAVTDANAEAAVSPRPAAAARAVATETTSPAVATPDVAIIGFACRLPGAPDASAFWDLLCDGKVAVSACPSEPWRRDAFAEALRAVGSQVAPWGGYLTEVDCFDPGFFNIKPDHARAMDPQQRLFLQTAWHALEMAGQTRSRLDGAECGVFVGGGTSDYGRLLEAQGGALGGETLLGNTGSILAARIAYFLNLRGPCIAMDTACSSGLVALHAGWRAILDGECDMALVGGVNLLLTPQMHLLTGAGGMLSAAGRCQSFDNDADGFVPSEGIVAVVLKRLDLALADNDPIRGVIAGVGVNQNGTTAGITAPSARAQVRLLSGLYEKRGIAASEIGLVEAHGTGTKIGDALEFDALRQVFTASGARPGGTVLASAKPAIGHAFAASGLASVVKLLLAFQHRQIPPMLVPHRPNEHMRLDGSPFRIGADLEPFPVPPSGRRMAAATSYGLSGTNAHVVLAEPVDRPVARRPDRAWHLVVLSGTDDAALRRQIDALATALDRTAPAPDRDDPDLADLAYTLAVRRTHLPRRAAFVARDLGDLRAQLRHWSAETSASDAPTDAPREAPRQAPEGAPMDAPALRDLAKVFVGGGTVDWAALYPSGQVCDLPGYRFARDRYWPDRAVASAPPSPAAPPETTDTVERLRTIIARVLRVDPAMIARDFSFDALGTDSVAAVTLMRTAEADFQVALPVIALWDHPSLEHLAGYIDRQPRAPRATPSLAQAGRTASGAHDPVVKIRDGGAGPASFWVHGGPGDIYWVAELARHLPPDGAVYGLEAQGMDGETEPLPTVEAMAAHYVAAVLRTQPSGPCTIGAYSGGGAIAFEMVRQMTEAGHAVGKLVLLDTNMPGSHGLTELQAAFGPGYVYLVVGNWFGLQWGMTSKLVLGDLDGLDKPAMLDRVVAHLLAHAAPPLPEADIRRHLTTLDRVGWAVGDALRAYHPQPLTTPIDVILFACTQGMAGAANPLGLPDIPATRAYRDGWDRLFAATITQVAIDCGHFELLRGANGAMIGTHLAQAPNNDGFARVRDVVIALVRETLPDVDPDLITLDRSMSELGATSIDRVEVATLAMETLGLTIPNQELARVGSIGELVALLHRHLEHV